MPSSAKRKPVIEPWLEKDGLAKIEEWVTAGLTDKQIAHNMGISTGTLSKWKKENSELGTCLKKCKDVADKEVENALYKSAIGFEYDEVTEERVFNPLKNKFEMVVTKKVHKVVLPSNTAQIFWLKNRKPDTWQDKRQIESTEAIDKLDGILSGIMENAKKQQESPYSNKSTEPKEV